MAKLYERLLERAARDTMRGHMPGHKGVPLLGVPAESIDFTELGDTGNLYELEENVIREAERDAALAAGAEWCVYSAGGSTLLIQGMLGVAARRAAERGRSLRVLAARDAHRAFFGAMALLGGDVEYIYPQYNEVWNISEGVRAEEVRAALAEGDYDAVYVTSPSYYGVMSDLAGISEACAEAGVMLLVDAAHGAHLVFNASERSRSCGGAAAAASGAGCGGACGVRQDAACGAGRERERAGCAAVRRSADAERTAGGDAPCVGASEAVGAFGIDRRCTYIMCCSAHKTLGALGGGAFALGNADKGEMLGAMQLFGSSSPSYVILASLDRAIEAAADDAGRAALAACAGRVAGLRERVAAMPNVAVLGDGDGLRIDPTRFVFAIDGADGREVAEWLERERGVVAEMADSRNVVFIMTAQDGAAEVARLEAAVKDCVVPLSGGGTFLAPPRAERVVTLRDALLFPTEAVRLADAEGRVAGEAIAPYPPGVPVVAPGEKISRKTIAFFKDIGYNVDKEVRVLAPQPQKREDM